MDCECFPTNLIEDICLAHSRRELASDLHCSEVHRDSCPKQEHSQNQLQYVKPEKLQALWLMCMLFYKFVMRSTVQLLIHHLLSLRPCLSLHSVLGGVESRGVLRKISDMLEVILKRMDSLSKLDNTSTTDARRLDELSSAISRYTDFSFILQLLKTFLSVSEIVN